MNFHGGNIYQYGSEKMIDFSSNINPYGVPSSFKHILEQRLDDFTRYPDRSYLAARKKMAQVWNLASENMVCLGNGAVEMIKQTIAHVPCQQVAVVNPTFSEYKRTALQAGKKIIDLPGDLDGRETIDLELVKSLPMQTLLVICNPNNPTGSMIAKESLLAIAQELAKKESCLMLDEAFIEFTDDYPQNSMLGRLDEFQNIFIIRAATKFFGMPGLRLGFMVTGNKKMATKIREDLDPWNINTAAELAIQVIYEDHEYITKSRNWIKKERSFMLSELRNIKGLKVYSTFADFILLKIKKTGIDAWQLQEYLLPYKILIRTPDGFENISDYHFRVAIKNRENNIRLLEALQEISKKYLNEGQE